METRFDKRTRLWLRAMFHEEIGHMLNLAQYFESKDGSDIAQQTHSENITRLCNYLKLSIMIKNNVNARIILQAYEKFFVKALSAEQAKAIQNCEISHKIFLEEVSAVKENICDTSGQKPVYREWFHFICSNVFMFRNIKEAWDVFHCVRNYSVMENYVGMFLNHMTRQVKSGSGAELSNNPNVFKHLIFDSVILNSKKVRSTDEKCLSAKVRWENTNENSMYPEFFYFTNIATQMYVQVVLQILPSVLEGVQRVDTNEVLSYVKNNIKKWFRYCIQIDDVGFFKYYWHNHMNAQQARQESKTIPTSVMNVCVEYGAKQIITYIRDDLRMLPRNFPTTNDIKTAIITCKRLPFFQWVSQCNSHVTVKMHWDLSTYSTFVERSSLELTCHLLQYFIKYISQLTNLRVHPNEQKEGKQQTIKATQIKIVNAWKLILQRILKKCTTCETKDNNSHSRPIRMNRKQSIQRRQKKKLKEGYTDLFTTIVILLQNVARVNVVDESFVVTSQQNNAWFEDFFFQHLSKQNN